MVVRFRLPAKERIEELLAYDPLTGIFTSRVERNSPRGKLKPGETVGRPDAYGYLVFSIDNKPYMLHRLAWVVMTGEQPPPYIDHRDRNKQNNAWSNLRSATASENNANKGVSCGVSGLKGVRFVPYSGKWTASVSIKGVTHHLGLHATADEARRAYEAKAREVYGEFFAMTDEQRVFHDLVNLADEPLADAILATSRRLKAIALRLSPEEAAAVREQAEILREAQRRIRSPKA